MPETEKLCSVCRKNPFKYQCPRCSKRTCCLECCQAHKEQFQCSGKRDRTAFLTLSRMDDDTLVSDYHFLEDAVGTLESSNRLLKQVAPHEGRHSTSTTHWQRQHYPQQNSSNQRNLPSNYQQHPSKRQRGNDADLSVSGVSFPSSSSFVPPKWKYFRQKAMERRINLQFMPASMQRHQQNSSRIVKGKDLEGNQNEKLEWKVEWRLHPRNDGKKGKDITSSTSQVSEDTELIAAFSNTLDNQATEKLLLLQKQYHFLIKDIPCPSNHPLYTRLENTRTLRDVLRDRAVIEYPTIEVVHQDCLQNFPQRVLVLSTKDEEKDTTTTTEK